ncbi:MAG: hypothetical protein ACKO95_16445 [Dolichospermum sp.]
MVSGQWSVVCCKRIFLFPVPCSQLRVPCSVVSGQWSVVKEYFSSLFPVPCHLSSGNF